VKTIENADGCGDYYCYIEGSNSKEFRDIRPGDMFIWKSGYGHVGVVESYNASLDQVTILEAIQNARGENLCPKDCKDNKGNEIVCTFQVRRSIYKRDGKALLQHPGWKGYFRLIEK